MRISDWSSDVCSSDLRGLDAGETANGFEWRKALTHQRLEGGDFVGRRRVDPVAERIDNEPGDADPERRIDEYLAVVRLGIPDRFQQGETETRIIQALVVDGAVISRTLQTESHGGGTRWEKGG